MSKTVFATLDQAGVPVELQPGQGFTTFTVMVGSEEEAAWSFTPVGQMTTSEIQHGATAFEAYSDEDLARFGIAKLTIKSPPAKKVLASYELELSEGRIVVKPTWATMQPPTPIPAEPTPAG